MRGFFILVVFTICFLWTAFAQGQVINDYDSASKNNPEKIIVRSINIQGNKITKERIVTRELLFHVNDTISYDIWQKKLEKSRENLLNTSLFNFVTIESKITKEYSTDVTIRLVERWYLWPFPIFKLSDRNFNAWWESKDFSRIDYGLNLMQYNCRGRNETLKLILSLGYNEIFGLSYSIPYINKKQTLGLAFGVGLIQNHQVAYNTVDNKQLFLKQEDQYPQKNQYAFIELVERHSIYNTHSLQIGFNYYVFSDSLIKLNSWYSRNKQDIEFPYLTYQFKSDHRDSKPYPLKGYYFDVSLNKLGVPNIGPFSTDVNLLYIQSSFRKYWQLNPRFYAATSLTGKYCDKNKQPYFIEKGLGYGRDFVRSYEMYVIDGQYYGLIKTNVKYALLPTKISKISFISTDKFGLIHYAFYLNAFIDAGFVSDDHFYQQNNLSNTLLLGGGVGLDFVTYYDKVFRLEYSINKLKESGIFIHFIAPI